MSITRDGWFIDTYVKWAKQTIALNLGNASAGYFMVAMFDDTITPNFAQTSPAYNSAPFNDGQVEGAGYDAGGQALTAVAFEPHPTADWVRWICDPLAWTGSTITGAKGALIYVPSLSNVAVLLRNFGQAYSTNDGTFGLNPHPTDGLGRSRIVAPAA
ncbi:hypothetical protein [Sphaerisporangium aureirubrum]|uniref:Uncharacterized protein n=1 Tax=Sphaerisporangium aureirubrum TaxID=1544736 RepID=A0ABW1NC41_9ACTN